jgi:hypothetical protein
MSNSMRMHLVLQVGGLLNFQLEPDSTYVKLEYIEEVTPSVLRITNGTLGDEYQTDERRSRDALLGIRTLLEEALARVKQQLEGVTAEEVKLPSVLKDQLS